MSEPAISSRAMSDADIPAVVSLLEDTLGPAPAGVSRSELFAWKHLRNPFGRSVARVAELNGEIVGLRSFMRWELTAGGTTFPVVRAVDTATARSAQRRGVFSRLTDEALATCREEGVAFVFNTPNERSRPGYMKMGWQVVGSWPIRAKVRRPDRLLVAALRRDLRSGPSAPAPPGSALVPVDDPAVMAPMEAASSWPMPTDRFRTARTVQYLLWRYADGPIAYRALAVPEAFAILRIRMRGSLREAVVCEAMAAAGSEPLLRDLLRRIPREAGADHAVAHLGAGWPAADLALGAGYVRLPTNGMSFAVRPLIDTSPDPRLRSAWSLTLGDLEVF